MNPPTNVEGAVSVRLSVADNAVDRAEVAIRRPVAVARALIGRRPEEAARVIPLLYSLCGTAQGLAAAQACEAALGLDASDHEAARGLTLDAECADAHGWQAAMEWPRLLGEHPDTHSLIALRDALPMVEESLYPAGDALRPGGGDLQPNGPALSHALDRVADWFATQVFAGSLPADAGELADWAARGATMAARFTARLLAPDLAAHGAVGVAALTERAPSWFAARLSADPGFSSRPHKDGSPAHTGPLARRADHPLVASVQAAHGVGVVALMAARLADMAELPHRMADAIRRIGPPSMGQPSTPATDPAPQPPGVGCGVVETARGTLAHWLRLGADGRIADYRTVAPTEWNFAPDGPLARGLIGLPGGPDVVERAGLLVALLDPCVACAVTVAEA
jgi:uptake hydrogenase large subunit